MNDSIHRRLLNVLRWLDLGDSEKAKKELNEIRPSWDEFPRIIKLKWCICVSEQKWQNALDWGRFLRQTLPQDVASWIQESEALNALDRTQEAWELLLGVTHIFEDEPAIPYLLACYSGRLGYPTAAGHWLKKAVAVNPAIRLTFPFDNEPDLSCLFGSGSNFAKSPAPSFQKN